MEMGKASDQPHPTICGVSWAASTDSAGCLSRMVDWLGGQCQLSMVSGSKLAEPLFAPLCSPFVAAILEKSNGKKPSLTRKTNCGVP